MLALQPIVVGTETESDYWVVARQHWQGALEPALAARVTAGGADMRSRVRAAECLLAHAPDLIALIITDLERSNRDGRLADLGIELSIAVAAGARADLTGLGLPALVLDIARLHSAIDADGPVTIDPAVATAIAALPAESETFRHFRTQLGMRGGVAVRADIDWLLEHSDEQNFAIDAINCAAQRGWADVLERATAHRFASVAAIAVTALAPPPPTPLPPEVLARLDVRGRPLRAAFLDLLEQRLTADAIPPLLDLTADQLSDRDYHDNANSLPIARRAVAILARHADLDIGAASTLLDIARTTDDPSLRRSITDLLATRPTLQPLLLSTATARGPAVLRIAASWSLVGAEHLLSDAMVASITSELVLNQPVRIAFGLALIVGWRGSPAQIRSVANALSAAPTRRVFLVALARARLDRDLESAREVADHLPAGHVAQRWALGEDVGVIDADILSELGSVAAVAEILPFVGTKAKPGRDG